MVVYLPVTVAGTAVVVLVQLLVEVVEVPSVVVGLCH